MVLLDCVLSQELESWWENGCKHWNLFYAGTN